MARSLPESGPARPRITTVDRLLLLLPLLMWVVAALDQLAAGQPAADPPAAPAAARGRSTTSPATSAARPARQARPGDRNPGACATPSPARSSGSRNPSGEMADALDGQRRLVREVHHRVKNNLQVVASLLNIHGRSADTPEARGRLCGDRPAGRRAVGRPPQPFRRDGGESRDRAAPAADRARRRASRQRARRAPAGWPSISTSRPSTPPRTSRSRSPSWSPRSSNSRCSAAPTTRSRSRCAGPAS